MSTRVTNIYDKPVRKRTRKTKQELGEELLVKDKFIEDASEKIDSFTLTKSQKEFVNKIRQHTLTFVDSEAGTGKTSAVLHHYAKEYIASPKKQIVVIRTPVEAGADKIGYLPNSESEKLAVHFASVRVLLEKFLGKGRVEADLEKRIHFKAPNYMLGATLDDSLILIDEAQQLQPIILKLLLERIGKNSKVVVAGCSSQIYVADTARNALADALKRFFTFDGEFIEAKYPDMAYHEFSIDECHRADIVKDVIRAYKGV